MTQPENPTPTATPTITSTEIVLILLLVSPFYIALNGYAISVLWKWFASPLGMPAISVIHGIGIDLLIGLFVSKAIDLRASADNRLAATAIPLVTLAIAWPIHLLMG